jgi:hypothetical protein
MSHHHAPFEMLFCIMSIITRSTMLHNMVGKLPCRKQVLFLSHRVAAACISGVLSCSFVRQAGLQETGVILVRLQHALAIFLLHAASASP